MPQQATGVKRRHWWRGRRAPSRRVRPAVDAWVKRPARAPRAPLHYGSGAKPIRLDW
jgi:hypothetical protein